MKCERTGKDIHRTENAAKAALKSLERAGRGNPDYSVYRCGDHWHYGHTFKKFQRRIRQAIQVGNQITRQNKNRRKRR